MRQAGRATLHEESMTSKQTKAPGRRVRRGMNLKGYDDAELVMELARGARSTAEIARRLGLCTDTINRVQRGTRRPDLFERICRARRRLERRLLGQVRRQVAAIRRRAGRAGRKAKDYDDAELVIELARGVGTLEELARRTGLAISTLCAIRKGARRAELQPLIRELRGRAELQPLQPVRRIRKRKDYDDGELVMELARNIRPPSQIARRFGLAKGMICAIRLGLRRRELQPAIRRARARLDRRLLARVRRGLVARVRRLVREGLSNRRGAREAREALLSHVTQDDIPGAIP